MTTVAAGVERPTLIVDVERVKGNIRRMAEKADRSGVRFRPHFKTHQSDFIGELYRQAGVNAICVSSVDMAEYFADAGWDDITLLVPANWRQIGRINLLAQRVSLGLHVDSEATARFLADHMIAPAAVWIEIDSGRKRTGVWWENAETVQQIAGIIGKSTHLQLRGLLTFAGQTYSAKSRTEISDIYDRTAVIMSELRDLLSRAGFGVLEISVGDTPACSIKETLYGTDEVRPGTLVYYDVMQLVLGACAEGDIAIAMACPVIAKYAERGEIVIYGGAVHLSRDWMRLENGTTIFGLVTTFGENGWNVLADHSYVSELSQEIGVIRAENTLFDQVQVGDVVAVLPVHVCLTMNEMGQFTTLGGDTHYCMPTRR
ncbi:MAG: alanine racemase [Chloroflexi bacterium]|nr:alanine racemase [Chloroflexota bacterium]